MRDINELRAGIDEIDTRLVALLQERMNISKEVAEYKAAKGLPVYVPEREAALLERVASMTEYPEETVSVYSAILSASRQVQERLLAKLP